MSARLGMRFGAAMRQTFQNHLRFTQRRAQSTAADASQTASQGGFAKLWNSEVGPKTVHFWAPIMKWGVVLAGASDFTRPAESLSMSQNVALSITGMIWTRWCFVIRPQNPFLASVNFAMGCVGIIQVIRILRYQSSLSPEERAKSELGSVERVVKDPTKIVDAAKGEKV